MASKTINVRYLAGKTGMYINVYPANGGTRLNDNQGNILIPENVNTPGLFQGVMTDPASGNGLMVDIFNSNNIKIGDGKVDLSEVVGYYDVVEPPTKGEMAAAIAGGVNVIVTIPAAAAIGSLSPALITLIRGDYNAVELPTPLGDITTRTKLTLTAKCPSLVEQDENTDSQATIQVVENVGLTILNGSTTGFNASDASLTVSDASAGTVILTVKGVITAQLDLQDLTYDCQVIKATGPNTPIKGTMSISSDVTQSTT